MKFYVKGFTKNSPQLYNNKVKINVADTDRLHIKIRLTNDGQRISVEH